MNYLILFVQLKFPNCKNSFLMNIPIAPSLFDSAKKYQGSKEIIANEIAETIKRNLILADWDKL